VVKPNSKAQFQTKRDGQTTTTTTTAAVLYKKTFKNFNQDRGPA